MPIFEFNCLVCGEDFEKIVYSTTSQIRCPKCLSTKVSKRVSAFATRTSSGFASSTGSTGCQGCTSKNCGSCH